MPNQTTNQYFVIVNPASGNWGVKKQWPKIKTRLEQYFKFSFAVSEYPRHAEQLVREAILAGYRKIIGVGGDGLLQEIANGIMSQTDINSQEITVCLISQGTGNDWIKTSGISKNLDEAIAALKTEKLLCRIWVK
jgi:diacylglycerol kinase (ATP)